MFLIIRTGVVKPLVLVLAIGTEARAVVNIPIGLFVFILVFGFEAPKARLITLLFILGFDIRGRFIVTI